MFLKSFEKLPPQSSDHLLLINARDQFIIFIHVGSRETEINHIDHIVEWDSFNVGFCENIFLI